MAAMCHPADINEVDVKLSMPRESFALSILASCYSDGASTKAPDSTTASPISVVSLIEDTQVGDYTRATSSNVRATVPLHAFQKSGRPLLRHTAVSSCSLQNLLLHDSPLSWSSELLLSESLVEVFPVKWTRYIPRDAPRRIRHEAMRLLTAQTSQPSTEALYVALRACYASHNPHLGLHIFWNFFNVADEQSCRMAVRFCRHGNRWEEAVRIMQAMPAQGSRIEQGVFSRVVHICQDAQKSNNWSNVFGDSLPLELFDDMLPRISEPSTQTYLIGIVLADHAKKPKRAIQFFNQIKKSGLELTKAVYIETISAIYMSRYWKKAVNLLYEMENKNILPDLRTYCNVMVACRIGGAWEHARVIFEVSGSRDEDLCDRFLQALLASSRNILCIWYMTKMLEWGVRVRDSTLSKLMFQCNDNARVVLEGIKSKGKEAIPILQTFLQRYSTDKNTELET